MLQTIAKSTLLAAACAALVGCLPTIGSPVVVTSSSTSVSTTTTTTSTGGGGSPPSTPPIQVTAITPSSDVTAGGASITISGSGFSGVTGVLIRAGGGGTNNANAPITSVTASQLVFTAPAFPAGLVDIDITRTDGTTARLVQSFLYYDVPTAPAPTLSSISPTSGLGGTVVTITGTDFVAGATITVGAEPADLVSLSATSVVVIVRPGAGGAQNVTLTNPDNQSATLTGAFNRNGAPVVTVNLPADARAVPGDVLTFTVSASDPEGDPLSLRLLNPPPGAYMAGVSGSGTQQASVRWHVRPESAGPQSLVFQAQDWQAGRNVGSTTALVQVAATNGRAATLVGDVTGDGIADIVSGSTSHQQARGVVYVWSGATGTGGAPLATCLDASGVAGDALGATAGQGVFLHDITGDQIDELIVLAPGADVNGVVDTGAVYVWIGGAQLAGTPLPSVVLTVPGAISGDRLGEGQGRSIRFHDVTGDGIDDLIVAAKNADRAAIADSGAIYVWSGGVQIVLATAPLATLDAGTPTTGDKISGAPGGQTTQTHDGFVIEEVTGDGIADIVATGEANGGSVYVWAGSATLSGATTPTATARAGAAWPSSTLALGSGQGLVCRDVTGDRVNDIVVIAEDADVTGVVDAGAVFVWNGGAGLTGTVTPSTVCVSGAPGAGERMGRTTGPGFRCQDLTGDGVADIVAAAPDADISASDSGALYVWNGGLAMTGTRTAIATLYAANRSAGDRLGDAAGVGWEIADCTGDGVLDIIAGSRDADVSVTDAGRICVWAGGTALLSANVPSATCEVPGASQGDRLGSTGGRGLVIADVDGDRILDIVAGSAAATNGSAANAGAVYAWFGGGNLTGTVAPVATYVASSSVAGDAVGSAGLYAIDIDGDGQAELIAASPLADLNGAIDAGGYAVWRHTAGLGGTVTAKAFAQRANPVANDRLGSGAIAFADLDNDGALDLVGLAGDADHNGLTDAGMLYLWSGNALLAGTTAPAGSFGAATPVALDQLGRSAARPLLIADTDGDGVVDALVTAPLADAGGSTDAGSLHRIAGGTSVAATPSAQEFASPTAAAGDRLGD